MKYTKPKLPNKTYQKKPNKPNLPNKTNPTKPIKPNVSNIPNQSYQTEPIKQNHPNKTYQIKHTKPRLPIHMYPTKTNKLNLGAFQQLRHLMTRVRGDNKISRGGGGPANVDFVLQVGGVTNEALFETTMLCATTHLT